MKLIGFRKVSFTADDGTQILGYRLFTIDQMINNDNAKGLQCDIVKFVKEDVFNEYLVECSTKKVEPINQDICIYYNKYKKPQTIMLNS